MLTAGYKGLFSIVKMKVNVVGESWWQIARMNIMHKYCILKEDDQVDLLVFPKQEFHISIMDIRESNIDF